ncbi:MAG: cytochrome c peroxidase [Minicystis sp.]
MKRALLFMAMFAAAGAGCGHTHDEEGRAGDGVTILEEEPVGEASSAVVVSALHAVRVGREIFFDTNLSSPAGQSCAGCHALNRAFTDPINSPTSQGVVAGRFGHRNAPTLGYAAFNPPLHSEIEDNGDLGFEGGFFWDGRANSLAAQAKEPFLNPLEMNNPDKAAVVAKVRASIYAPIFRAAFGDTSLDDVDTAFDNIAVALERFEQTRLFFPLTSKYDAFLAGKATLSPAEARGHALFIDPARTPCAECHTPTNGAGGGFFTKFGFYNHGLPKNPNNPFYSNLTVNPAGSAFDDRGFGAVIADPAFDGAFKAPTLRNVARTGPYMHNGVFSTLKEVVHFYNTRDVASPPFPAPEFPGSINTPQIGNLGLTSAEEDDIVAFLGTLNDATPTIDGTCTAAGTFSARNREFPGHAVGLCGVDEFFPEEAAAACGGKPLKYFGYSCANNTYLGTHTWTAYFSCCQ